MVLPENKTALVLSLFQLDEILRLEESRRHCQLWTPLQKIIRNKWSFWSLSVPVDYTAEDDDPGKASFTFVPSSDMLLTFTFQMLFKDVVKKIQLVSMIGILQKIL